MNTTIVIIVLVVLILLVGGALVFFLIKGKKEEKNPGGDTSVSPMTFQEQAQPQDSAPQEPQMFTPQMQTQAPATEPMAPVMQDLNTPQTNQPQVPPVVEEIPATPQSLDQPMNTPSMQAQQVPLQPVDNGITQNADMYQQETTLPNTKQMTQDMNNLTENSANTPINDIGIAQPNTPIQNDKTDADMKNIMDALNNPQTEVDTANSVPISGDGSGIATPDMGAIPTQTPVMPDLGVAPTQTPVMPDANAQPNTNPMQAPTMPDVNTQPDMNTQPTNNIPVPPMGV